MIHVKTFRRSAAAVAAVTAAGFGVLMGLFQAHSTMASRIEASHRVTIQTALVENELLRADRAVIGYHFTGSTSWLEVRDDAVQRLRDGMAGLKGDVADETGGATKNGSVDELQRLVEARIAVLMDEKQAVPTLRDSATASPIRLYIKGIMSAEERYIARRNWLTTATYVGFLVVLLAITGSFLWFCYHVYGGLKSDLLTAQKMKEDYQLLLKELNHRVKNSLQTVASMLRLQSLRVSDESATAALTAARARVSAIAAVHEGMYDLENPELQSDTYITKLLSDLERAMPVDIDSELQRVMLPLDSAVPLSLILNELITNSVKYNWPKKRAKVHISFQLADDPGHWCMTVRDEGPGFPAGLNLRRSKSLGLSIINALSVQLAAVDVRFENDNGAVFHIVAPRTQKKDAA